VALTGGRHGDDVAWVAAGLSTTGLLRQRQHLAYADPDRRLEVARWVLEQKAAAMLREVELGWLAKGDRLRRAICRTQSSLTASPDIASLTGIEGALAADWFTAVAASVDRHWGFRGRNRRPPRDPLNALLSYGYALAFADALAAVQRIRFDPAIGFLHEIYPGRYSLPLDAMECLRPSVDAIAVQLLWSVLTPENFKNDPTKGCRLNKNARLALIRSWHHAREQASGENLKRWCHALRMRLGGERQTTTA
jgi:CRISPR-associated protein Cas1